MAENVYMYHKEEIDENVNMRQKAKSIINIEMAKS